MINIEKLRDILEQYKQYFPTHWKNEKYKWEAVAHFQKYWDADAENFGEMFKKATDKTQNLLASFHNYPKGMILEFCQKDDAAVRRMFARLYDESTDLAERMKEFIASSEEIRTKYDNGSWKNHYQNTHAVSIYLWLRYPDKYYIYKYEVFRKTAELLDDSYRPKSNGAVINVIDGFRMYDEICEELQKHTELQDMLRDVLTDTCYPDPMLRTMTGDVGFYVARFYADEKSDSDLTVSSHDTTESPIYTNEMISDFHSNQRNIKWFTPIITALLSLNNSASRPYVHEKIIQQCNISSKELEKKNKTGTSQLLNDIDWARNYLTYEGILDNNAPSGIWSLTALGQKIKMTNDLAEKIIIKWIKIKAAERENKPVPIIDLRPFYQFRISIYTKQDFLNQVYMTSADYDTLTELLRNKQNIILQGAPGVGKTFTAKRLAYAMMGEKDDSRIEFIQFHQSYSYEDFIMGYRPDEDGGFTLTNGVFYEFCNTARNDPDRDYFFIIDEINRGNLSKIFGELLMLIEKDYRTETARLAYKNEHFSVPKNLYLIGMMNTADRSLAMIDYALRRRFSFFDMMPGFKSDGFAAYRDSLQNDTFNALIAEIIQLNHTISQDSSLGDGFCIGHSYFCNLTAETCTDARLRSIVKYDILPLLREYWFDDRDAQQAWADRLCGVFHDE